MSDGVSRAEAKQLPEILRVYEEAREFMAQNGNPTQWGLSKYPQEELLREEERKTAARKKSPARRRWFAPAALAGAALSFALLTGSLLGQARMPQLSDQILTAREEVIVLRQERDGLQSLLASDAGTAEAYAAATLGMQQRSQEAETAVRREDKATVLGIRRGQGFTWFCRTIIDKVGEYLH